VGNSETGFEGASESQDLTLAIEIKKNKSSDQSHAWDLGKLLLEVEAINSNELMCKLRCEFRESRRRAKAIVEYIKCYLNFKSQTDVLIGKITDK
jgi:hypothetical protein